MKSNPIRPHINADIIKDSVSPAGKRLTTFVLEYPRWVHSELMTHRMLSRNGSSSRAIPVNKIIQQVIDAPAVPIKWVKNQAGMQGYEEVDAYFCEIANGVWLEARDAAVKSAKKLVAIGIHKQLANRLLEPFHHIKVVVTATELQNLFALRLHHMAEDNFQALMEVMKEEFLLSAPQELNAGQWHLPFVSDEQLQAYGITTALKCSTARCARVSYMNHDGTIPDPDKDIKLHDDLVVQKPLHASPAEHQGQALADGNYHSGNFVGFIQYRKMLAGECATKFPWE